MGESSIVQRERRARRKRAGFCTRCGTRKPTKGYKTCRKCRKTEKGYARKERARRRATGLCCKCGTRPPVKGRNWCLHCCEQSKKYRRQLRNEIFAHYGGYRCVCCGETHPEFLHIDHIHGGGYEHRKKLGRGHAFYHWLKKNGFPEGYRVLCANCNLALGFYGYCPHHPDKEVNDDGPTRKSHVKDQPAQIISSC